jgi:hypothetical protein
VCAEREGSPEGGEREREKEGGRTFLVCRKFGGGEVVRGRARVELPSKVEDVVFGESCGSEAVKSTQRLDLRLLCTSYARAGGGRGRDYIMGSQSDQRDQGGHGANMKQPQCAPVSDSRRLPHHR